MIRLAEIEKGNGLMEIKKAVIDSSRLTRGDYGLLTAFLMLNFGNSAQGFAWYVLCVPKRFAHDSLQSLASHFLWPLMAVAGVARWDALNGKTVRVRAGRHGGIQAIGHIVNEDWFCPRDRFSGAQAGQGCSA